VKKRSRAQKIRRWIQFGFFGLVLLVATAHALEEKGITIPLLAGASLHAICPFGGVVTLYEFITAGNFVQKIHQASLVLMGIVVVLSIFFGPVFCGWICPFGTFQEWIAPLGKRLFKKRYGRIIPAAADGVLRYLRYVVLIWVVIMTAISAKLVFSDYDPYFALFNFWTGEVALAGFIALGFVILLSLVVERPFCRYACPYGALLGITNFFRIYGIRRSSSTCIDCGACDRNCPMAVNVSGVQTVRSHQCISCMECSSESACPVSDTVVIKPGILKPSARVHSGGSTKAKHTLSPGFLGTAAVIFMLGGIGFSMLSGWWITSSTKIPSLIKEGELAGSYDPADIRGSYTLADIERSFGVPVQFLIDSYGLDPVTEASYAVKSIEASYSADSPYEMGTDSVRWIVSLYLGYPYTPEDTTGLPLQGLELLIDEGRINRSTYDLLAAQFGIDNKQGISSQVLDQSVQDSISASEKTLEIKGKTSFAEVIEDGIPKVEIERLLGIPIDSEKDIVRDVCLDLGIEFSEFRTELVKLLP
jgi:polyferredoxin